MKIQAWPFPRDTFANPDAYLSPTTVQAFLPLRNLRILELDIPNSFFQLPNDQEGGIHFCSYIRPLLDALTTLHLCLPEVCPDVLTPIASDTILSLENVIVNLSLYRDVPERTAAPHSGCCSGYSDTVGGRGGGGGGLAPLMQTQAQRLVEQMSSPVTVRVLDHTLVDVKLRSPDVLSSKTMLLERGAEWDDDGRAEEEFDPESEFTDSDANDSFFDSD